MSESETPTDNPHGSTHLPDRPQLPTTFFQERERQDEAQILAEMRGELVEELVYSAPIQGRQVTNLSYAGIKEGIRRRGNVEILEVRTEETAEEFRVLVRVRDHDNHIDVLGASSAEKKRPFAYVLAHNKAERNAFAKLIPAKWYAILINEYLARRKGGSGFTANSREVLPGGVESNADSDHSTGVSTSEARADWHVPAAKLTSPVEGITEEPIFHASRTVGTAYISQEHGEVSLVPEIAPKADSGPVRGFLVAKFLEPLHIRHPEFEFKLSIDSAGYLSAVLIRMSLESDRLKEVFDAVAWSFAKAVEAK